MDMKKTVKIIWMTALAAGAAFTAEGVDAFSYVQKGLAACYDGIENAGAGTHDPNATMWVDLTGNPLITADQIRALQVALPGCQIVTDADLSMPEPTPVPPPGAGEPEPIPEFPEGMAH